MKTLSSLALVGALALGFATTAQAQSLAPQIPTPANPNPLNPVATDGTPLPSRFFNDRGVLLSGRSAYVGGPVGNVVGAGVDTAGALVGTGLGTAGAVVNSIVPR